MSLIHEARPSDTAFIETVTRGWTLSAGSSIRPAENHWHMVFVRTKGRVIPLVVGALTTSGTASWGEGAEILWIKFRLGTFLPHLPTRELVNKETLLPGASSRAFWLKGSAWEFPTFENTDTFVERLVRAEVLVRDPVVNAALQDQAPDMPPRTLRHRFLQTTGLSHSQIRQMQRAQQAMSLLQRGVSILDTVYEAGYFDQPHLTRSLKQFVGYTPAQIARQPHAE